MEPKHKELLDQCHQNLLKSITDADRLIELLTKSGTLSQRERYELDQNCSSSTEKVEHLLKMLMNKESDHFLDLCVALEKTYPHLYSALFTNGGGPVDHSGKSPTSSIQRCNLSCRLLVCTRVYMTCACICTAPCLRHFLLVMVETYFPRRALCPLQGRN